MSNDEAFREAAVDLIGQAARILPKRDGWVNNMTQYAWFFATTLDEYAREHKQHPANIIDGAITGLFAYLTVHANRKVPNAAAMILFSIKKRADQLMAQFGVDDNDISKQVESLTELIESDPKLKETLIRKWGSSSVKDLKR